MQETKKAFRKLPNLEQALTALSNLKGVGTTMASALLAAAAPDSAPFMADECLMAIPEIEGIDYTTKEYLNFVQHIQTTVSRLNTEKDNNHSSWSAHRVELAIWTHYVATELQPELLDGLPPIGAPSTNNSQGIATAAVADTTTTNVPDDSTEMMTASTLTTAETTTATTTTTVRHVTNGNSAIASLEQSDESNLEPPSTMSANGNNGNG